MNARAPRNGTQAAPGPRAGLRDGRELRSRGARPSSIGVRQGGEPVSIDTAGTWCSDAPRPEGSTVVAPASPRVVFAEHVNPIRFEFTPEACPSIEFTAVAGAEYDLEILHADDKELHRAGSRPIE